MYTRAAGKVGRGGQLTVVSCIRVQGNLRRAAPHAGRAFRVAGLAHLAACLPHRPFRPLQHDPIGCLHSRLRHGCTTCRSDGRVGRVCKGQDGSALRRPSRARLQERFLRARDYGIHLRSHRRRVARRLPRRRHRRTINRGMIYRPGGRTPSSLNAPGTTPRLGNIWRNFPYSRMHILVLRRLHTLGYIDRSEYLRLGGRRRGVDVRTNFYGV